MTEPAIVRGNQRSAVAYFIEDTNGDLVDITYICRDHDPLYASTPPLPWPAFSFSTDYDTCCAKCGTTIHTVPKEAR